ncbi:MAG TPA: hypothetical protein VJ727_04970, partial [Rhodanobacteraceae bacterium]|nr:hypothetical protein [Rhodanobacteraceae bacterium]
HRTVEAWAIRANPRHVTLLLCNHAFPQHPIETEAVTFSVLGANPPLPATLRRIDDSHANAKAAWVEMGQPEYPDAAQLERLDEASQLREERIEPRTRDNGVEFKLDLPPHAVAAIDIQYR